MNNIEILEEFIEQYNASYPEEKEWVAIYPEQIESVENLIQENKELKEKVNMQQEQLNIANKKILAQKGQLKVVNNSYIPKSKVKEKIKIRKEEKAECKDSNQANLILREIYVLEELLEG